MRTMINATLAFGAVFVPVGVAKSAGREEIKFRTLHVCGEPIKKRDWCPACETTITESTDIVKGWEFAKNTFVQVNEDDMAAITEDRSRMIRLHKFVKREEIDANLVERSYFLQPNSILHEPYELVSAALLEMGVVGIGKATLWGKEFPVAVESDKGILMLRYLFCNDELRSGAEIVASLQYNVNPAELALAKKFIKIRAKKLTQDDLAPVARQKAMEYLESLAKGVEVKKPDPTVTPEPTIDLMKTLKEMMKEEAVPA